MFGGILLFDEEFIHVVTITFTSLILTELLMVALTIRTWHWLMVAAEVFSLAVYIATLAVFKDYFGKWINFFWNHHVNLLSQSFDQCCIFARVSIILREASFSFSHVCYDTLHEKITCLN